MGKITCRLIPKIKPSSLNSHRQLPGEVSQSLGNSSNNCARLHGEPRQRWIAWLFFGLSVAQAASDCVVWLCRAAAGRASQGCLWLDPCSLIKCVDPRMHFSHSSTETRIKIPVTPLSLGQGDPSFFCCLQPHIPSYLSSVF